MKVFSSMFDDDWLDVCIIMNVSNYGGLMNIFLWWMSRNGKFKPNYFFN